MDRFSGARRPAALRVHPSDHHLNELAHELAAVTIQQFPATSDLAERWWAAETLLRPIVTGPFRNPHSTPSAGRDIGLGLAFQPMQESTTRNATADLGTRRRLCATLLVGLTLVAYLPALQGEFIWDDNTYVVDNPNIHSPSGLRTFWFSTQQTDYWPMALPQRFGLEWRLWGKHTLGLSRDQRAAARPRVLCWFGRFLAGFKCLAPIWAGYCSLCTR